MNHNTLTDHYQKIWKGRTGLQMIDKLAELGYRWASEIPKGQTIDIGCGDGTNALILKKMKFDVQGVEISQNAVKKALSKGISAKVVDLNSEQLPYKNKSLKFVWCSEVIEHVFWPDTLMAEISRVLRRGGYLYLTTPNIAWYGIRLTLLFGKTLQDVHPEHIHWFNEKRLKDILKKHGFKIEKFSAYRRYLPFPLTQKISFLERFNTVGKSSNIFTYSFAVLAIKK